VSTLLAPPPPRTRTGVAGERAARRDLRRQIARLERRLSAALGDAPRAPASPASTSAGPRLLTLAELERDRDELLVRIGGAAAAGRPAADAQASARRTFEEIVAEPGRHRFARIANADMGLPGCTTYAVRPRLGLLGMLAGWWELVVSSGCP
jgi:hypothetical protein